MSTFWECLERADVELNRHWYRDTLTLYIMGGGVQQTPLTLHTDVQCDGSPSDNEPQCRSLTSNRQFQTTVRLRNPTPRLKRNTLFNFL